MKKAIIAIVVVVVIIVVAIASCSGGSDDWAASQNWGKGYYYNSSTGRVERNLRGIFEDAGWG